MPTTKDAPFKLCLSQRIINIIIYVCNYIKILALLHYYSIILETYSSNGGLLAISSRGVCDIRSQEDNRLLKHC